MFKKVTAALAALGLGALAACGSIGGFAQEQTGIEITDPYEAATGFVAESYVTVRLYEATLDSMIYACDETVNPKATETPDELCEKAADAADKISPAVQAAAHSIGTYVYLDGKVEQIRADGEVVPDEILFAASEAFYKARTEWADVKGDIDAFIGK